MLFSCANPDAVISEMASDDTLSGIIADSITFFRSDSGVVRMELYAPRFVRMDNEDDVMEFPLGFHVFMYDGQHQLTTELLAGYGKSHGDELLEARDSVVVRRSEDGQVMYSDKLFWYQKNKMIYTRSHVRIVTDGKNFRITRHLQGLIHHYPASPITFRANSGHQLMSPDSGGPNNRFAGDKGPVL